MDLKRLAGRALATLALNMLCLVAFAEGRQITGTVVDGTGETVIGANVLVVGTTNGVITDMDGNFTLQDVPTNAKLQISFIGYVPQTISVGNQNHVKVTLKEDSQALDEVVVIGYGTVKKRDLTGSVASVNNEVLTANPVSNVSQALQGKLPGVTVISQDGRPGADVSIRVRGGGSITQSNEPLFVVDGFPVSSISDIPADQIESIDVLKDASSTAIYGARGANGVILVTTKGAKSEKVTVTYNAYIQTKTVAKTLDALNAQDYVKYTWGYASALGNSYKEAVEKYFGLGANYGNKFADYANVNAHDYTDDLLHSALSHTHNLSVMGGGEKTKIVFNVNYLNDEGIKINSGYHRFNTSLKLKQELLKNLSLDLDLRYMEDETTGKESSTNGKGSILSGAYRWRAIDNPLGDASDFSGFLMGADNVDTAYGSPVAHTNDVQNIANRQNLRASAAISWDIIKGLTARSEIGLGRNWSETKYYEDGLTQNYKYAKLTKGNGYNIRSVTTLNYQVQGLSEIHSLSFLLGNEILINKSNSSEIIGAGYPDGFDFDQTFGMIDQTDKSLAKDAFKNTIGTPKKTVSFFGRANYSLLGRYLLTATFRADGSSKFNKDNRYGYFPSGSLAWSFSEEEFMKPLKSVLSSGKVRLSWGLTGNNRIGEYDYYALLAVLKSRVGSYTSTNSLPSGVYPFDNDATNAGVVPTSLPNKDLKWETTEQWNAGLDLGFFDERIGITMDIYRKTTRDLLLDASLPFSSGYYSATKNIGKVRNDGLELSLNTVNFQTRAFKWTTNFNISFNKNKVLALSENQTALLTAAQFDQNYNGQSSYIAKVGLPMGLMYGYVYEGTYKYDDFNKSGNSYSLKPGVPHYSTETNTQPGMPKYADLNGDGVVDSNDRTIIGRGLPIHTGGFTNNFEYKGIDLSVFFQWSYGNDIMNANRLFFESSNNRSRELNQYASYANRWTPENPTSDIPAATNSSSNRVISSRIIEDGSYLRLKNVTVGYTFPAKLVKKWKIDKARVYVAAQNLWTCTGYSGYDPEVSVRNSALTPGLDYSSYPRAYSISFGVSLGF